MFKAHPFREASDTTEVRDLERGWATGFDVSGIGDAIDIEQLNLWLVPNDQSRCRCVGSDLHFKGELFVAVITGASRNMTQATTEATNLDRDVARAFTLHLGNARVVDRSQAQGVTGKVENEAVVLRRSFDRR